ncbi:hypothetical protein [Adhaeribacter aerolatus]|uniref:hypothetical protein n=1 Tax=Adhaeribacter aerolatus TaxID=670289 RepID=UPI001FE8576F|nr:hypothetical protein [Adhaeribacter aerolatus]
MNKFFYLALLFPDVGLGYFIFRTAALRAEKQYIHGNFFNVEVVFYKGHQRT